MNNISKYSAYKYYKKEEMSLIPITFLFKIYAATT